MKYIMALDQGTTSSRCILFDEGGGIAASAQHEFCQHFPKPGWVEHDAEELWQSQYLAAREAMEKLGVTAADIAAIGIANQRETTLIWDRRTGKPISRAIVWQCRRTADYCRELKGAEPLIHERTGLVADPYFSATKLRWLLDSIPDARERAEAGELAFGTVDSWLIWKLTGGRVHATDCTNASRTLLYNIHKLCWDGDMLRLFGIPVSLLPEVKMSSDDFGCTDPALFGGAIAIRGVAGDQHAALFGHGAWKPGDVKNTYGTGGFMLMNTGDAPVDSRSGLLTTLAWGLDSKVSYALEGSVFVAGAVIQWLRDELGLIKTAPESEIRAKEAEDNGGVYFVPAFTGLGAPYWNSEARGAIVGLTRGVGAAHICRAALESIAYQTNDVLLAMRDDAGALGALRVDGGAAANNFLMQFQADISRLRVIRPRCIETTALGAASLAAIHAGVWDRDALLSNAAEREFTPEIDENERNGLLEGWRRAVGRVL